MLHNSIAFINGKIITIDNKDRIVEAILVIGNQIAAVGSNSVIKSLIPPDSIIIDLNGQAVIPGLVDSHNHLELLSRTYNKAVYINTPPFESLNEIMNYLSKSIEKKHSEEWLIVRGPFNLQSRVRENCLPTRHDLDRIAPSQPLTFYCGAHVTILNTIALNKMGWTHETTLPHGSSMGRDMKTGEATGIFTEVFMDLPLSLPNEDEKVEDILYEGAIKHSLSHGVTTIHELPHTREGLQVWQQLRGKGKLPLRLRFFLTHPYFNLRDLIKIGLSKGFGDHWLSLGGIKIFVDGIGMHANLYPMEDLKWTQEELDEIICDAHKAGFQIWSHIITDAGLEMALRSFELALKNTPHKDHRHRLEHVGDRALDTAIYERIYKNGLVPISTPDFIYVIPGTNPPLRSLMQKKFILPGNTDVAGTEPKACNPWLGIWCCVQRKSIYGDKIGIEEKLTPLEAIRMYTKWAAWGGFEETVKGSIEPGKLADLVVLRSDPLTIDPDKLPDMAVDLVMIDGVIKKSSPDYKIIMEEQLRRISS